MTRYCYNCGQPIGPGAQRCPHCDAGQPLGGNATVGALIVFGIPAVLLLLAILNTCG